MNAHMHVSASSNFADKVNRQTALVYDVRATLNGEARYFIIKVPPAKREAFLQAVADDAGFKLEDFGEIIHRGWDAPPDALKVKLNQQYGMYADEVQA